ncbi:uncharacterized protein J3D65DRAFT_637836 [Phyllosticta citribraziliensis]|uniref:Uncharacterized protein n=1 Tax=Phyllosticta citribraziliensis TaxID=989973 RepID=A0ABR1LCY8_9PEZI
MRRDRRLRSITPPASLCPSTASQPCCPLQSLLTFGSETTTPSPNAQSACTKTPQDVPPALGSKSATAATAAAKQRSATSRHPHPHPHLQEPAQGEPLDEKELVQDRRSRRSPTVLQGGHRGRPAHGQAQRRPATVGKKEVNQEKSPWARFSGQTEQNRSCGRLAACRKVVWKGCTYTTLDLSQKAREREEEKVWLWARERRLKYWLAVGGLCPQALRFAVAMALNKSGDFFAPAPAHAAAVAGWLEVPSCLRGKTTWVVDSG